MPSTLNPKLSTLNLNKPKTPKPLRLQRLGTIAALVVNMLAQQLLAWPSCPHPNSGTDAV